MTKSIKALFVIAAYMAARAFIYAKFPATDYEAWFLRDMGMTVPRVAGFLLSLWLLWGIPGTFWLRISPAGAGLLLAVLAGQVLAIASFNWVLPFRDAVALTGWATTLAVAFFEETCFRGVLFQDLKQKVPPLQAALLSTAVFTVYHLQAQKLSSWPAIFLVGFLLCAAYHRGAGLLWLVAAHELMDALYLHVNTGDLRRLYLYAGAYLVLAPAAAWSAALLSSATPQPAEDA